MQNLLHTEFPNDYRKIGEGQWLVSASGTARELSDRLERASLHNNHGSAVIMRVTSYWGRASNETWEWLSNKMQAGNGS